MTGARHELKTRLRPRAVKLSRGRGRRYQIVATLNDVSEHAAKPMSVGNELAFLEKRVINKVV
jgi:hypothetical protein